MPEIDAELDELKPMPGALLKSAREGKKLSQAQVADKMHLSVQFIIDIENDDYSHFAAPIYVRGYLQSYARIVGVDEQRILEAYGALGLKPKAEIQEWLLNPSPVTLDRTYPYVKQKSYRRRLLRWLSLLFFIIVLTMAILWWRGQSFHQATRSVKLGATSVETQAQPTSQLDAAKQAGNNEAILPSPDLQIINKNHRITPDNAKN